MQKFEKLLKQLNFEPVEDCSNNNNLYIIRRPNRCD